MSINEKEILKAINEALYKDTELPRKKAPAFISESYVVQAKNYDINTDMLSEKAVKANVENLHEYVNALNDVSAKLDSADRSASNPKDSSFRGIKKEETYNLNGSFLSAYYFDNIADPTSKITMDSLTFMRLTRDFGTFEDWQKDFIACGMASRNGWVCTVYNGFLNRYMNIFIDGNEAGIPMSSVPIVVLSVQDRAYFRDYLNDRRKYIFAMMKELNWDLIELRVKRADKLAKLFTDGLGSER
jgi:Fe-Mn family superoxide dismutase